MKTPTIHIQSSHAFFSGLWAVHRDILWIVVVVLIGSGISNFLPRIAGDSAERLIQRLLRRAGIRSAHDLILRVDQERLTQIDHLALLPWGIAVIETKLRSGNIYGTAKDLYWIQRLGGKSHRFQNPLRQNFQHLQAVRRLAPGAVVRGFIIFAGDCYFPKGKPECVLSPSDLIQTLRKAARVRADPQALEKAWQVVTRSSQTDQESRRTHLRYIHARFGGGLREPIGVIILVVAGLLAAWLWLT